MASKIYITSGLGPAAANEGFTENYDLPNDTAYAETCASVALIFWAQRMLHLNLDGRYADVMEQALFNGALTGLSRDGEHYFYSNPLDSDGRHSRWAWHTCPCCTMNASRLVASVGGYFVSHSDDAIAFHLYGGISMKVALKSGSVSLRETSTYPWSGDIRIEVEPDAPLEFTLKLRIPGWVRSAKASVNGKAVAVEPATVNGYLSISRRWRQGDVVSLDLPMPPERIYAHPSVSKDVGRVALKRGPLVYCVEEADNPEGPVQRLRLPKGAKISAESTVDAGPIWPGGGSKTTGADGVGGVRGGAVCTDARPNTSASSSAIGRSVPSPSSSHGRASAPRSSPKSSASRACRSASRGSRGSEGGAGWSGIGPSSVGKERSQVRNEANVGGASVRCRNEDRRIRTLRWQVATRSPIRR
jgi:hypothetical protein